MFFLLSSIEDAWYCILIWATYWKLMIIILIHRFRFSSFFFFLFFFGRNFICIFISNFLHSGSVKLLSLHLNWTVFTKSIFCFCIWPESLLLPFHIKLNISIYSNHHLQKNAKIQCQPIIYALFPQKFICLVSFFFVEKKIMVLKRHQGVVISYPQLHVGPYLVSLWSEVSHPFITFT